MRSIKHSFNVDLVEKRAYKCGGTGLCLIHFAGRRAIADGVDWILG